jgi:hypothetical protein
MSNDRLPNPHNCPACETMREAWEYCPTHTAAVDARESEASILGDYMEEASDSFKDMKRAVRDMEADLMGGLPGIPYKGFINDVKDFHSLKLRLFNDLAALQEMVDKLAIKHAGKVG